MTDMTDREIFIFADDRGDWTDLANALEQRGLITCDWSDDGDHLTVTIPAAPAGGSAELRERVSRALIDAATDMGGHCDGLILGNLGSFVEAVLAALGDQWAEDLANQTGMRGMEIRDGVVHLGIEPAREILLAFCASARAWLDEFGAVNYTETTIEAPKVEFEIHDGKNASDWYVLTVQRKFGQTPHQLRRQAERERDEAVARVAELEAQLAELGVQRQAADS